MKRITAIVLAILLILLLATPVMAASLNISPATVEIEVPANGSAEVTLTTYKFTGDISIDCENIPLKVEPATVSVTAKEGGDKIVLTFYGDASRGCKIYEGKIRFVAMTGGMVAMGIKVKAKVTNLVAGETPVPATLEESRPATTEESRPTTEAITKETTTAVEETTEEPGVNRGAQVVGPEESSSGSSSDKGWTIITIAGIGAATIVAVTLIIVLVRRKRG